MKKSRIAQRIEWTVRTLGYIVVIETGATIGDPAIVLDLLSN